MGTRYEDQPAEHWAGAESLDPTPVWKQYLIIAGLLLALLVAVVVFALSALAPLIVTPPALVPGDRFVLSAKEIPPVGGAPKFVGPPLVNEARRFWLIQPAKGELVAVHAVWSPRPGGDPCRVDVNAPDEFVAQCSGAVYRFDGRGAPKGDAPRGLDRYLVSMGDDRVIVNLSRLIQPDEKVPAP